MKTKLASRLEGLLLSHSILIPLDPLDPLDLGSSAASLVIEGGSYNLPNCSYSYCRCCWSPHTSPLASHGHHSFVQVRDIRIVELDRRQAVETSEALEDLEPLEPLET